MYKDKDKQREASKARMKRYRARKQGVTSEGVTNQLKANQVTPNMRRGKEIQCFADLPPDIQATIIRLTTNNDGTVDKQARTNRTAIAINYQHLFPDRYDSVGVGCELEPVAQTGANIRVSKPGDADYVPLCKTTEKWVADKGLIVGAMNKRVKIPAEEFARIREERL